MAIDILAQIRTKKAHLLQLLNEDVEDGEHSVPAADDDMLLQYWALTALEKTLYSLYAGRVWQLTLKVALP